MIYRVGGRRERKNLGAGKLKENYFISFQM